MGWTDDLINGLGQFLETNGVGNWDPTTVAEGQTRPIVVGPIPDSPDEAAGLTPYNLQADPVMADVVQPIQILLRGTDALGNLDATADLIFGVLHGLRGVTIGGIHCSLIFLFSDVRMGVDQAGRNLRALNYYFEANRQTATRPD